MPSRSYRRYMHLLTNITERSDKFAQPESESYAEAVASFNLLADLRPAAAMTATSVADVVEAISTANRAGLPLSVFTTGHAALGLPSLEGALLVKMALDARVQVDAERRVATVPAGASWGEVVAAATEHGLAAMHGSSATVGAIGYLLRGGLSFYGRLKGLASNSLRSVTLITSEGHMIKADASNDPDLFWAIRGGGGGFGIITEVEIDLFPMWQITTGFTAWSATDAHLIAPLWRKWTESAPREVTTSIRLMNLPPLPGIPAPLVNGQILVLDGAITIETEGELSRAREYAAVLLEPLRAAAAPVMDTWHTGSPADLIMTHMDPPEPAPARADHYLLNNVDDSAIDAWLAAAGPGSSSVLAVSELRQLGGAFRDRAEHGGVLNGIDGQFAALNVGIPMGMATVDLIRAQMQRIRETLSPFDTGFTAPTFVEEAGSPHRALPADLEARVEVIRQRFDPSGMFALDVMRATIR